MEEHIESCAACREIAGEVTAIDALARDTLGRLRPMPGSVQRFEEQAKKEEPRAIPKVAILVAAAAVLLMSIIVGAILLGGNGEEEPVTDNSDPNKETPRPKPKPDPIQQPDPDPEPDPDPDPDPVPDPGQGGGKALVADPEKAGTIQGEVTFLGAAPAPTAITMGSDAVCLASHDGVVYINPVSVLDGKLRHVLVYVKGVTLKGVDPPKDWATLRQKGCMYEPHVVAVMRKQDLKIINDDATSHNVHFLPDKNQEDNFTQQKKGMETTRQFKVPEIGAKIKCDVHPWMSAYLHVLKNPLFAVTGINGNFEIKNVPPGVYTLIAWHGTLGVQEVKVTVEAKQDASTTFTFKGN